MIIKAFRFGMWMFVFIGLLTIFLTTIFLNPYRDIKSLAVSVFSLGVFYFGVVIFSTGIFSLILFWIRRKAINEKELQNVNIGVSFRQSILLSITIVIILIMQSFGILLWWDALLAVGAIMMIELYFLAK